MTAAELLRDNYRISRIRVLKESRIWRLIDRRLVLPLLPTENRRRFALDKADSSLHRRILRDLGTKSTDLLVTLAPGFGAEYIASSRSNNDSDHSLYLSMWSQRDDRTRRAPIPFAAEVQTTNHSEDES
jgi:hypothetical protein